MTASVILYAALAKEALNKDAVGAPAAKQAAEEFKKQVPRRAFLPFDCAHRPSERLGMTQLRKRVTARLKAAPFKTSRNKSFSAPRKAVLICGVYGRPESRPLQKPELIRHSPAAKS